MVATGEIDDYAMYPEVRGNAAQLDGEPLRRKDGGLKRTPVPGIHGQG